MYNPHCNSLFTCCILYRSTLKLCAGCKLTRYCSRDCQKQHWSVGHKKCCGHDVNKDEALSKMFHKKVHKRCVHLQNNRESKHFTTINLGGAK